MNTETLAPVYLDNQPVTLKEPKPKVSAILSAGGKPNATEVKWLKSSSDTQGKPLRLEEVVDRTSEPTKAIYLTCASKGTGQFGSSGTGSGTASGGSGRDIASKANAPFQSGQGHDDKPSGSGTDTESDTSGSQRSFEGAGRPKGRPSGKKAEGEMGEADAERSSVEAGEEPDQGKGDE
jgi:hypothetical protein